MTEIEIECRWSWIHAAFDWDCWQRFYRLFPERVTNPLGSEMNQTERAIRMEQAKRAAELSRERMAEYRDLGRRFIERSLCGGATEAESSEGAKLLPRVRRPTGEAPGRG